MSLSQRAAAAALGMALSSYQQQERGINRQTGQPIRTPLTLLLACAALEHGLSPIRQVETTLFPAQQYGVKPAETSL